VPLEAFQQNLKIINFGNKEDELPFKLGNKTSIEEL